MIKPRIKIWRNFRGDAMWQCIGRCSLKRYDLIGRGRTPADAYVDWQESCDFPF